MTNVKLITGMLLTQLMFAASAHAGTPNMSKGLEKDLINICEALKSDSAFKIKRAIKTSRINKKALMNGLVCNGMTPLKFALSQNANESAEFLVGKGKEGSQLIAVVRQRLSNKG